MAESVGRSTSANRATLLPRGGVRGGVLGGPTTFGLTVLILVVASAASLLGALANTPYFESANAFLGARDTVARGLLYSSWLVVIGGPIVVWRPDVFGFRLGDTRRHWRLVVDAVIAGAGLTALLLTLTGATPYSGASPIIKVVVVPFTEELVFRAVLLTALLIVLGWLHEGRVAIVLAVLFSGAAFGIAQLANVTSLAPGLVVAQAGFATVLGAGCAYLMVRTRSVYPAMLLHAVVNAIAIAA